MLLSLESLIGFGIAGLVTLLISIHLIKSYLKNKVKTVGYFAGFIALRFFLFLGIILACLVYLLFGNLIFSSWLIIFTFAMIFLSLVFPPLLFCSLKWPKMKNFYVGVIGLAGIIGMVAMIVKFSPAVIIPTGDAYVSLPELTEMLYLFAKFGGVLPLSLLFLLQLRGGERKVKIRSLLIGLGLLWVASTALVPNILATLVPLAFVGVYCCIGDILILAGVKYQIPRVEEFYQPRKTES